MLNAIIAAARSAGTIMLQSAHAAVHRKEGHFNLVTDADVAVQAFLQAELRRIAPDARFYAEEQENAPLTDAPTFVVDPIDGTLNFARGRHCSAISIALLKEKQPVLGVIWQPYSNEMFSAAAGEGACLNGSPIHVASVPPENAVVSFGTSPYNPSLARKTLSAATRFLLSAGDLRRSGSAALDLCELACGRSDIFFELQLQPWDVAAGSLIVQEAGGIFRSLGHAAPYYEGPGGMLACTPQCESMAMDILAAEGCLDAL